MTTTSTAAVGLGLGLGLAAIAVLFRPPSALPDRLGSIDEKDVKIDNDCYDDTDWWEHDYPLQLANQARVPYFLRTLQEQLHSDTLEGVRVLDIGCGGGLVTEAIATQSQAQVVGLDVSKGSIERARQHSSLDESRLQYTLGSLYNLPFPDESFDAIICSDVLEHLLVLPEAAKEFTRVLKPGGVFAFDTINRTFFSWYAAILIFQKMIAFVPNDAHDWRLFLTPAEVDQLCKQVGLRYNKGSPVGMRPTARWPWEVVARLYRGRGWRSFMGGWTLTSSTMASFLSFAVKDVV
ncbi:hypothetical protein CBS101457_006117 [Exobasidium rhododendri]|nr:hypothetical protein CBS101457_006117 [Exobasidium rhododendri]